MGPFQMGGLFLLTVSLMIAVHIVPDFVVFTIQLLGQSIPITYGVFIASMGLFTFMIRSGGRSR